MLNAPVKDRHRTRLCSRMATLAFTDIEASTRKLAQVGDGAFAEMIFEHYAIIRSHVSRHGGIEIREMGDGLMLEFPSPGMAGACLIGVQRDLHNHGLAHPHRRMTTRSGIHTGEVLTDNSGTYVGLNVHLAARVTDAAHGGEVLITAAAQAQIDDRLTQFLGPRCEVELNGLPGTYEVSPLRWRALSASVEGRSRQSPPPSSWSRARR